MTTSIQQVTNADGLTTKGFRAPGAADAFSTRLIVSRRADSCYITQKPNDWGFYVVSWRARSPQR